MLPLVYFTIAAAFIADFLDLVEAAGPLGRIVPLFSEAGSFLLLIAILLRLTDSRQLVMSPKYMVLGALIILHMAFGLVLNSVSSGAIVAGLRDYFRFLPLFFVPAVVDLTERDVSRFLKFLLALCLLQVPVSIYQRLFIYPLVPTGDVVRGTLATGSMVSILLICAISVLAAFWIRGFMSLRKLIFVSGILLIPTLINETKATILLFACSMVSLGLISAQVGKRFVRFFTTLAASVVFVLAFAAAYDFFFPEKYGGVGLLTFYSDRAIENEYQGIDDPDEVREVPRIDSLVLAYKTLKEEPMKLLFGLGVGNVSHPNRNAVIEGEFSGYYTLFNVDRTTYTQALWEIGLLGTALILALTLVVFIDSWHISRANTYLGAFALGWTIVVAVLPLSLLYKSLIHSSALVALLMLLSGYFAALRLRAGVPTALIIRSPEPYRPEVDAKFQIPKRKAVAIKTMIHEKSS